MSRNFYSGAIHVHTKFSDGTGDINQISKAAQKAGLTFVIISDHNNFDAEEGIINGILVIKGEELSPKFGNHYLALGTKKYIEASENPVINIENVRNQGGFGFIAHPDESLKRKNRNQALRWTNKSIIGDGIEIWNWFSDWADNYNDRDIFHVAYSYFFRRNLIKGAKRETLFFWDELNNRTESIIPAIGGADAHALKIKKYIIPVTIFRYEYMFKTITNRIILDKQLPENFEVQKSIILSAIKEGRNIIINREICENTNSIIIKITNGETEAYSGDSIKLNEKTYLIIELPIKSDIKIIHSGLKIHEEEEQTCKIKIKEVGKYRVEVYNKKRAYIYTNPILVI